MPLQTYFNKLVLRGSASDGTPTTIQEDSNGDLLLTSGSGSTKLAGSVQYHDGTAYQDLNATIGALQSSSGNAPMYTTLQAAYDGGDGSILLAATPLIIIKSNDTNDIFQIKNQYQNQALRVSGNNLDLTTPGRVNAGWMTLGGVDLQDTLNSKLGASELQDALDLKQPLITEADTLRPHSIDLAGSTTIQISGSLIKSIASLHLESYEIHLDTDTVYYRNSSQVDTLLNTTLDALRTDVDTKQNTLTAGDNIVIIDNVISCGCDTVTYTEGSNINIGEDDTISVEDDPMFTNSVIAGSSKIGGFAGSAGFAHKDLTDWRSYAVIQRSSGLTIINTGLNMELLFRHNGTVDMAKFDKRGEFWITRNGSLQKLNLILDNIPTYTAGANITITDGVIEGSGNYTAGANITIVDGVISSTSGGSGNYTAGANITIVDGVISSTGGDSTVDLSSKQDRLNSGTDIGISSLICGPAMRSMAQGQIFTTGDIQTASDLRAVNIYSSGSIVMNTADFQHNMGLYYDEVGASQDGGPGTSLIYPAAHINSGAHDSLNILNMMAFNNDPTVSSRSIDIIVPVDIANDIKLGEWTSPTRRIGVSGANQPISTHLVAGFEVVKTSDGSNELAFHTHRINHGYGEKMRLSKDGYLGIGTTTPSASLDVRNEINIATWGTWFGAQNIYRNGEAIQGYARRSQTHPVSIMGRGILSWNGFYAASDSRFKTNILDINDSNALVLLRKIKPKTYEYIDKNERGSDTVYGFIAQDIAEIFPNCVSQQREKIPNIYALGTKTANVIAFGTKSTNLLQNDSEGVLHPTLLVYHPDGLQIEVTIKSIIDEKHIEIEPTDELDAECQLFVYGQVVDDFHTIDKNYIFTIATAALQEVDRELQIERAKTAVLESQMAAILARLDAANI